MDKGRLVFAGVSGNLTAPIEVVGAFNYLDSGALINEGNMCPSLLILSGKTCQFSFGIRVFPLGSNIVAEHEPAEEGTYKGGDYLNRFHKTNSIREVIR